MYSKRVSICESFVAKGLTRPFCCIELVKGLKGCCTACMLETREIWVRWDSENSESGHSESSVRPNLGNAIFRESCLQALRNYITCHSVNIDMKCSNCKVSTTNGISSGKTVTNFRIIINHQNMITS